MDKTIELLCSYDEIKAAIADSRTYWIVLGGSRSLGTVDEMSDYDIIVYGEYDHETKFTTISTEVSHIQIIHNNVEYLLETLPAAWPTWNKIACCGCYLSPIIHPLYIAKGKEEAFNAFFNQYKEKASRAAKILLYRNLNTIKYCINRDGILNKGHRIKRYYYILLAYYTLSKKEIDLDLLIAIKHMSRYNKPEIPNKYYDSLKEICLDLLNNYAIDADPIEENELIYVSTHNTVGQFTIIQNMEE